MVQWLHDSGGHPIAFVKGDKVFSANGKFIGRLDDEGVWHGEYRGEIVKGNRFLYKTSKGSVTRGTPGTPGTPGIPGRPGSKGSIGMPSGYRDVVLDD